MQSETSTNPKNEEKKMKLNLQKLHVQTKL